MILRLTCTFILLIACTSLHAQTHTRQYDVITDGEKVGNAVAVKKLTKDTEHILITCDMSVKMLFRINVSYKLDVKYKNGVLISSSAVVNVNGRIQNKVDVERTGNTYIIVKDGDSEIYTDLITWSSASLYFYFPDGDTKVFSEADGSFKHLQRKTLSTFELTDPESTGLRNTYTYAANRGLENVFIDKRFIPNFELSFSGETYKN
jgi:hypothetical protein